MEPVIIALSCLVSAMLVALIPSAFLGAWVYTCKSFRNLEKADRMYLLLAMWLIFSMVAYLLLYESVDVFNAGWSPAY